MGQGGGEFFAYDRCDAGAENLDGPQHLLVRERRDTHLEGDARDAAEHFVHVEDFLRNGLGIADEQSACGSADGVELRARGRRPAAFLADLGEGFRIAGIKVVGSLPGGFSQEANGVQAHN